MRKAKLPAPRLQLRWEPYEGAQGYNWQCHYELVLPLDKCDVRAEVWKNGRQLRSKTLRELVVPMKPPTVRGSTRVPCEGPDGSRFYDDPYRDGAHAFWDAKLLGNPPIYVIAPDGVAFPRPNREPTPPTNTKEAGNG